MPKLTKNQRAQLKEEIRNDGATQQLLHKYGISKRQLNRYENEVIDEVMTQTDNKQDNNGQIQTENTTHTDTNSQKQAEWIQTIQEEKERALKQHINQLQKQIAELQLRAQKKNELKTVIDEEQENGSFWD